MPIADSLTLLGERVEKQNTTAIVDLFHEDCVYHDTIYGTILGIDELVPFFKQWWKDGSNYIWRFYDEVQSDDLAYARWYFSYNLTSKKRNLARIEVLGYCQVRFRKEKIVEYKESINLATPLFQMNLKDSVVARQLRRFSRAEKHEMEQVRSDLGID